MKKQFIRQPLQEPLFMKTIFNERGKNMKQKNKLSKYAIVSGMCALAGLSANAIGVDVDIHANPQQGIGAGVDADIGLARANVGANVGADGVNAGAGADVIGVGANTAAHVGFDGVKARANTYAWNVANVGANAGATWKDGVYVGGTAKVFEPANTVRVAAQNGQVLYVPQQPAPAGYAWVYGSNGRVVGYQPVPQRTVAPAPAPVAYVQQTPVAYYTQTATVAYPAPAPRAVRYETVQQPAQYVAQQTAVTVPAEREEVYFQHEQSECKPGNSRYSNRSYHEIKDPARGYHYTDKRQFIRTVTIQHTYGY